MTLLELEQQKENKINTAPEIRVVDPETGKLGYFYSPQQIEELNRKDRDKRYENFSHRRGSHALANAV